MSHKYYNAPKNYHMHYPQNQFIFRVHVKTYDK